MFNMQQHNLLINNDNLNEQYIFNLDSSPIDE